MTIDAMDTVTVQILGKEYKLSCPADERDGLLQAARLLDERMKELKGGGMIGLERIAVMAALNLGYELLQNRGNARRDADSASRLDRLLSQAEEELLAIEQLNERNRPNP
ncbi:MAG: cell division protein ZapA [Pseudomonadota bacterium]